MDDKLPDMQYRVLGRTGLRISVIGFGGWLTSPGGRVDRETAFECIKKAYDAGVNFFDTAEGQPSAMSETFVGQAIKRFGWKQKDLIISTKIFEGSATSNRPRNAPNTKSLARKHIFEGMDASLRRLDLPYVDVVYARKPDLKTTPIEEIVRAFNDVVKSGKAIYWGTYDWSEPEITEAIEYAEAQNLVGPAVDQPEYNLLARARVHHEYVPLLPWCLYGMTTHSPLRKGILTGKYNIVTAPPPGSRQAESRAKFIEEYRESFGDESWDKDLPKVEKLKGVSRELGVSLAQLSIAWTLKNEDIACVITGASREDQVVETIKSLEVLPRLTAAVITQIKLASGNNTTQYSTSSEASR
ncbi:NADP-dependent oxidoreductase domain-containing protein [Aspergillus pseudoustus]|uniref:NADP-dependent oxidoreductase domain-containing protein n=1 Tax=Aspergillus pseudoustus TaxID=1810923 RepID=A0ABR4K1B7_9EURO